MGIVWMPPSVCPSIHPSSYMYLLNHWVEFNLTCYITSPLWYGFVRATLFFHLSVCPSVHHTISPEIIWQNLTRLATWLPRMVRVCESKLISFHHAINSNISTECGVCNGVPLTAHSSYLYNMPWRVDIMHRILARGVAVTIDKRQIYIIIWSYIHCCGTH